MITEFYYGIDPMVVVILEGVKVDTAANPKYIMSLGQYNAYCDTFGLRPVIRPPTKGVTGSGGRKMGSETVKLQIRLPQLGLIIDVNLLLIKLHVQKLLLRSYMLRNGFVISLQGWTINYNGNSQEVALENYFWCTNGPRPMYRTPCKHNCSYAE